MRSPQLQSHIPDFLWTYYYNRCENRAHRKHKKVRINIDQKISFNKHISTHIFRHTHVSFLAEQGIPLEVIQERVGHRKGSTVTEIYLHITEKMKDTVAPIIDDLISLADNDS